MRIVLLLAACWQLSLSIAAYAPNHFLGTCLTKEWVASVETVLNISATSRDSNGQLLHPFLRSALQKPRYSVTDPRTASSAAYTSDCLTGGGATVYGAGAQVDTSGAVTTTGKTSGTLVFELNGWPTHSLSTMVLSILAAEVYGYEISYLTIYGTMLTTQRMSSARTGLCTPSHANMEVWITGKEAALAIYVNESSSLGSIGYFGLSGLYTSNDFISDMLNTTTNPNGPYFANFWNGYKSNEQLISAVPVSRLKNQRSFYPPADSGCADGSMGCLNSCAKSHACKVREDAGGECLVVVMMYDYYDPGYLQAVMSNIGIPTYFCFLGYSGMINYVLHEQANGKPVLFYHYEPDLFHFKHAGLFNRVFLPRSTPENVALATGTYGENGFGMSTTNPVSVDFPSTVLSKYVSNVAMDSPRLGQLFAKAQLSELHMNTLLSAYLNASNNASVPDPTFYSACDWVKDNFDTWTKWLEPLPICTLDEHMKYTVIGCNDSSRTITFMWKIADPQNASSPYECDGGLTTLPAPLQTSRSCDWITDKTLTWTNWLQEKPTCDASFYSYNVSDCGSDSKREVNYFWLLADPSDASKSLECDTSSFTMPSDLTIDCEYIPSSSPIFAAVAILDAIVASLLVVAMILVYINRTVPIIKRSQFELLELMIFGGLLICAAIIVYAGKPTDLLCALRPIFIAYGFTTIFGALIVKSLRVYRVFMKSSMKRKTISTARMLKLFALFCLVDIIIIGAWFIADFPGPETSHEKAKEFDGFVDRVICNASGIFSILLMFWKAIVLFAGLYISFLIRHVSADFQESFWTFASALVVLVGSLLILPLAYMVQLPAAAFYVFLAGSLLFCLILVMGFMLGPKVVRFHEEATSRTSTGSALTTKSVKDSSKYASGNMRGSSDTTHANMQRSSDTTHDGKMQRSSVEEETAMDAIKVRPS